MNTQKFRDPCQNETKVCSFKREREREREGFVLYICMSVCLSFGEFYKGKNEQNEAYARNEGGLVDKR